VTQPVDAVAHHKAHGAGVIVGPDRFRADGALGFQKGFPHPIQRLVPRDARELAGALRTGALQRVEQAIGMMDTFGVARDLGADHAGRIAVVLIPPDPADRAAVDHLHFERAGRRAIVRADGGVALDPGVRFMPAVCLKAPSR
jgi:hypothetical protein